MKTPSSSSAYMSIPLLVENALAGRHASRDWHLGGECLSDDPGIARMAQREVHVRAQSLNGSQPQMARARQIWQRVRREAPVVALGMSVSWREAIVAARTHDLLPQEDQNWFRQTLRGTPRSTQ